MRIKDPQLFVQDDYKVLPNLTVNLGLRYEATTGMSELHNAIGGVDPNIFDSLNRTLWSVLFFGPNYKNTPQKPRFNIFFSPVGFFRCPNTFKNNTPPA